MNATPCCKTRAHASSQLLNLFTAAVRSIALHGLPPLGPRRGSSSNPAENHEHKPANLKQHKFIQFSGLQLREGVSAIWALHANGDLQSWASEMDVQQLVKAVLQDAITAAGLGHLLKCYNELSIFKLRPDIWVVMNDHGVPVGVCEVKKPGRDIIDSRVVHGQIYDYMLRLRSFHGIKHVFGIVSTYEQWRLYWLDDCASAAAATTVATYSFPSPSAASSSASSSAGSIVTSPVTATASDDDSSDEADHEENKQDHEAAECQLSSLRFDAHAL